MIDKAAFVMFLWNSKTFSSCIRIALECLFLNSIAYLSFFKNISDSDRSDDELLLCYRQYGQLEYLGALYARYMELVYGVCLKYLKDPESSKDSTMQVFEELITKVQKHTIENFRSWLYVVAKNHCLMKLRASKNRVISLDGGFMQSGEDEHPDSMEKEDRLQVLEACIGRLKADQQRVIRMFYLQEKCYKSIVMETSLDWNQVRSLVQNGRRNLRLCIERSADEASGRPVKLGNN